MSIFTIKEGKHRPGLWPVSFLPWLSLNPEIHCRVQFSEAAIYDSPAYNEDDVNKLVGLGFGWLPFRKAYQEEILDANVRDVSQIRYETKYKWEPPHHKNSARFGWVWSVKHDCWKLLAYCYADGVLNSYLDENKSIRFPEVLKVPRGATVELGIKYDIFTGDTFFYAEPLGIPALAGLHLAKLPAHLPCWGWKLGVYFGGYRTAPHNMSFKITSL